MRLRFPHPLVLLVAGVLLAAALTWIVPAGVYERRDDPATGKPVVVPGTYHAVERAPVGPFDAVVQIPKGLINAADVVFFVFLVGGAFTVVDKTGALRQAVDWLADRLQGRRAWVIPVVCVVFAAGGALENLQEEIIALVPVLLLLCRRLGLRSADGGGHEHRRGVGRLGVQSGEPIPGDHRAEAGGTAATLGGRIPDGVFVPALGIWIWESTSTRGGCPRYKGTTRPRRTVRRPRREGLRRRRSSCWWGRGSWCSSSG